MKTYILKRETNGCSVSENGDLINFVTIESSTLEVGTASLSLEINEQNYVLELTDTITINDVTFSGTITELADLIRDTVVFQNTTVDLEIIEDSENAVSGGAVFTALQEKADLVDGIVPVLQLPEFILDADEFDGIGSSEDPIIAKANGPITKAGNAFNGNSQLVKTTSEGKLPALDGSLLTGITGGEDSAWDDDTSGITYDGNVGINTASSSTAGLSVQKVNATDKVVSFKDSTGAEILYVYSNEGAGYVQLVTPEGSGIQLIGSNTVIQNVLSSNTQSQFAAYASSATPVSIMAKESQSADLFVIGTDIFSHPNDLFKVASDGSVGIRNESSLAASVALQVGGTTKASIPFPKVTATQKLAISSPVVGSHVYQTDETEGVYQYKADGIWHLIAFADVHSELTYASTVDLDFNTDNVRTINLTGNLTLTSSNKGVTKAKVIRLIADSSARTLTFPSGWVFVGGVAPSNIASNKTGILSLYCFGSNETDVVASYMVQS